MGWHKTTVDGKVMWEAPDGQRVADLADIHRIGREPPPRTIYRTVSGVNIETAICWVLVAGAAGIALGRALS